MPSVAPANVKAGFRLFVARAKLFLYYLDDFVISAVLQLRHVFSLMDR